MKKKEKEKVLPFDGRSQRGLFSHILLGKGLFEISGATADGGGEVAAGGKLAAGSRRSIGQEPILLSVKGETNSSGIQAMWGGLI